MFAQDFAHPLPTAVNPGAFFHESENRLCLIVVLPAVRCSCFRASAGGARRRQNDGSKSGIILREPGPETFQRRGPLFPREALAETSLRLIGRNLLETPQVCEMGLYGFHRNVRMGTCCLRN